MLNLCTAIGAPPNKCTPDPAIITIHDSYADPTTGELFSSRLRSDGMPYVNGVDGVEALIRSCPGGTGDVTFSMGRGPKATRSFTIDFSSAIYRDSTTPTWASGAIMSSGGGAIGNILFNYSPSSQQPFTTMLGLSGFPNPNYYFRMVNPTANVAPVWGNTPGANTPCMTSLVHVRHHPASGSAKEKWEVWPDLSEMSCSAPLEAPRQVGALLDSRTGWSSVGQFRFPFFITIQRK